MFMLKISPIPPPSWGMVMAKKTQVLETAFNRYETSRLIGEGGTGRVWCATDSSGAKVAVKILSSERATAERRKRFKNEILFCLRARHPNIVRVLDYGVTGTGSQSAPFYVMPLLEGSFRSRVAETQVIPLRLAYFDQVLSGVEAAHLQGVVHRDLKPENVLYDPLRDTVVVADFGIAHFTDEELYTAVETKDGTRLANFQYSAPEQRIRNRTVDTRTDIYSLGLMLNELLTGEIPLGTGFKTVACMLPDYEWVDEVVSAMIQQDPDKRPESIDHLKRLLITREQDYVTRQRLSQIKDVVVPVGEEDDPLALSPPRIVDFEWQRGQLAIVLSRPVNPEWVHALRNMGNHSSVLGKGPEAFVFSGDRASIPARDCDVQPIIDYFKSWLPRATEVYRQRRQRKRHEAAERELARIRAEKEELERQRRLRNTIRL